MGITNQVFKPTKKVQVSKYRVMSSIHTEKIHNTNETRLETGQYNINSKS